MIVDVGRHENRVVENSIEDSAVEGIAVVGGDGSSSHATRGPQRSGRRRRRVRRRV
ncbi:hypothetical protein [Candidatus Solirubrobacter pratensis]|uniref:hypothetical protein n=1 Tax=Candidatus Solirubrobacter pratensis TaxID=1298857 RepID=UPI0012DCC96A|nr:hypothetical protein [Candidatus Solirubrobacter pratensis]